MGKKKSRRQGAEGGLTITSMMDMMTIILCFLLKSYQTTDVTIESSSDLQIPTSSALAPIKKVVQLVVTKSRILVDGEHIVDLEQKADDDGNMVSHVADTDKKGQLIDELYNRLLEAAEQAKENGELFGGIEDAQFKGQIMLQCDHALPFSVIREVMYTAGQAQFGEFKFVVIKASG